MMRFRLFNGVTLNKAAGYLPVRILTPVQLLEFEI